MTFNIGDIVAFNEERNKYWQGGKAEVIRLSTPDVKGGIVVRIIESIPENPSNSEVGKVFPIHPKHLKLWDAAEVTPSTEGDAVEHPAHYGGKDNPYEVIKVAEAWGLDKDAYLFNVLKYIARAGKKGAVLEDLRKGHFYLGRKITNIVKEKAK